MTGISQTDIMNITAGPDSASRALSCLDLTSLPDDDDTGENVRGLCARAVTAAGQVAAVCVWPAHVGVACRNLTGTGVAVATVVNFPSGDEDIDKVVGDTTRAIADGASEIDVVFPWNRFLDGAELPARKLLAAVRAACGEAVKMKVILETGQLQTPEAIHAACMIALEAGADMLKTSTGKVPVGATFDAVREMAETVRDAGSAAGIKVSGGVKTADDAARYMALVGSILGENAVSPARFRIGASSVLDDILAQIGNPAPGHSDKPRVASL